MEIRRIETADARCGFTCGEPNLDAFFSRYAVKNTLELRVGTTYVVLDSARVVGFFTVAMTAIRHEEVRPFLPQGYPRYDLPALLLARMGVERKLQGSGIGRQLLSHALQLAVQLSETAGCVGVVVDAKKNAVSYYNKWMFFEIKRAESHNENTPMFLPIQVILDGMTPI